MARAVESALASAVASAATLRVLDDKGNETADHQHEAMGFPLNVQGCTAPSESDAARCLAATANDQ